MEAITPVLSTRNKLLRVLLVEDCENDGLLLLRTLKSGGYTLEDERVECAKDLLAALESGVWDVVICDYCLPQFSALAALQMLQECSPDLPCIVVSGAVGEEVAVATVKAGAYDYLLKGSLTRLVPAVERAIADAKVRAERKQMVEALRRSQEELESRVKQRTAELAKANEELRAQIAERQKIEHSLRESEARLQAVLDYSSSVIFLKDTAGRYLLVNRQFERLFRLSRSEVIGRSDADIFPEKQAASVRHNDSIVLNSGEAQAFEESASCLGQPHVSIVSKFPVRDASGKIYGVGGIATDITARKRAEEELRLLESITRSVSEASDFQSALHAVLRLVCDTTNCALGQAWMPLPDSSRIECAAAWHATVQGLEKFRNASAGFRFLPGEGLPGRAWQLKKPVWIPDVTHDANFPRKPFASAAGLKGALAIPVLNANEVLAILEFFVLEHWQEDERMVQLISSIAAQLGMLIQRKRVEDDHVRLLIREQAARQRLEFLSQRLLEIHEEERRTIACELHDEVGQVLTGLSLTLGTILRLRGQARVEKIAQAQKFTSDLMTQVRDMSLNLRPGMLDDLGLLPALLWHFERYTQSTNVQVDFKHDGIEGQRFAPELETAAYRIMQEALTNVARHARVSQVFVRCWIEKDKLCVQIEDRGVGFDAKTRSGFKESTGVGGMRERALLLGGELTIESRVGAGTKLIAQIPVRQEAVELVDVRTSP